MKEGLEAFRKQNELMKSAFGINRLANISELVKPQIPNYAFRGLDGIASAIRLAAKQPKTPDLTSVILANSLPSQIDAIAKFQESQSVAIKGLTATLSEFAASNNKMLADSFANLAASRLTMTSGLAEMAKAMQMPQLKKFNALDVAIGGLSNSFLREISKLRDWEELEVVDEANKAISNSASEIIDKQEITNEELLEFLKSIQSDIQKISTKTKSQKTTAFLFNLANIISILITFYSFYLQQKDISNSEVFKQTGELIRKSEERMIESIDDKIIASRDSITELIKSQFRQYYKLRFATTNVNLRSHPRKKSQIIGVVSKGQEATVLEIHHKYLLITYIDFETGEPMSGFVVKKYFKLKDANKH